MRRFLVLLVAGLLAASVGAPVAVMAKSSVAKVTGTVTYFVSGNPSQWRTLSLSAQATDPVKGTWTWTRPSGTYSGPVSCLVVSGSDAWIAGPAPGTGAEPFTAVFYWVHDGGKKGDAVFG